MQWRPGKGYIFLLKYPFVLIFPSFSNRIDSLLCPCLITTFTDEAIYEAVIIISGPSVSNFMEFSIPYPTSAAHSYNSQVKPHVHFIRSSK